MTGDKYHVHYTMFGDPGTHTEPNGPWDTWRDAKAMRNGTFLNFCDVQSCWVMVTNDVYKLQPKKYGETLRRQYQKSIRAGHVLPAKQEARR